jgi:hypothetical protein
MTATVRFPAKQHPARNDSLEPSWALRAASRGGSGRKDSLLTIAGKPNPRHPAPTASDVVANGGDNKAPGGRTAIDLAG